LTDDSKAVEQYALDASQAHTELVRTLVESPLEYPLAAYRILSGLTRSARELLQLLELLEGGVDRLRAAGRPGNRLPGRVAGGEAAGLPRRARRSQ
jgi:hypothetical protein